MTSIDRGSSLFQIDPILPEPLLLEAGSYGVLEWKAALEVRSSGFQTGIKSSGLWDWDSEEHRVGKRLVASSPSLTSAQGTLLLSALCHGVMWYFFRKEGSLSLLVLADSPTYSHTRR